MMLAIAVRRRFAGIAERMKKPPLRGKSGGKVRSCPRRGNSCPGRFETSGLRFTETLNNLRGFRSRYVSDHQALSSKSLMDAHQKERGKQIRNLTLFL